MGHTPFLGVRQTARNRLLELAPRISGDRRVPLNLLISQQGKLNHGRVAVIMFSIATVALGVILSFVPWLDYIIFRELKLWNGSISYSYWQKPGVARLTKVYIFNVTNPQAFLEHGEKPRLVEVGPFVYREDMEKVNIRFSENGSVSFQHRKILRFAPDLSVDKEQRLVVPNIPLLTVTSFSPNMAGWLFNILASGLSVTYRDRATPFVHVTAEELVFGYNDPLVSLAHIFYPKGKRPNSQMGLLLARNGTLGEVSTIQTGESSLHEFGYIQRIDGRDRLPHWRDRPCNDIRASEGSFFPPRAVTGSDLVHIYDKDLCRILPLKYRHDVYKDGIQAGLYTPPASTFECAKLNPDNKCYCRGQECPPRGLQNISPCQYNAPVYLSFPHFYDADPALLGRFEGLQPDKKKHETYFMIQPKLGVPLEGQVRVQLNLKVERARGIRVNNIHQFPDIIFPVMWVEEGIHEVTTPIWRWIFLATRVGPIAAPVLTYSLIALGLITIAITFFKAYKNFVLGQNSLEFIEIGDRLREIRRGSTLLVSSRQFLQNKESHAPSYQPLRRKSQELLQFKEQSRSVEEFKTSLKADFVRSTFSSVERESLLTADNEFIIAESRHKRFSLNS